MCFMLLFCMSLLQDGRHLEVKPSALLGRTALAASTTFMAASINMHS
jgi:hypothetical protein